LRLGEILIKEGLLDDAKLDRALRVQKRLEAHKRLGEVLVELGYVSRTKIKEMVKKYRKTIRLSDLLIEKNLITVQDLMTAVGYMKEHPGTDLGEYLVNEGILNERNLMYAISEQLDLPYIEPDIFLVDKSLYKGLSLEYLRLMCMIPFSRDEETQKVTVIVAEPNNPSVRHAAEEIFSGAKLAIGRKRAIVSILDDFQKSLKEGADADADDQTVTIEGLSGTDSVSDVVDYLIRSSIQEGASDIHIEPMATRTRVRFRIDGVLVHRTDLPAALHRRITSRIKILCDADVAERRRHQDGRINYPYEGSSVDLRVSIYVTVHGENVVIRILQQRKGIYELSDLGMGAGMLDRFVTDALDLPSGVVFITGPTGSGKTTSLYSAISYSNEVGTKIITAEDPVEFVIEGLTQCSINEKIGLTFADTLRSIVRQDPDIIVLGEVRDKETAEIAIQASLTGHKVYTTFHTEDSVGALLRLIDMKIETFLIASTVACVVAQRLVRRICPDCRQAYTPGVKVIKALGLHRKDVTHRVFYRGNGCSMCHNTGYRGRVGIYEVLYLDPMIKDAILQKKPSYEVRELCMKSTGFCTMLEDGIVKVFKNLTTFEDLLQRAPRVVKPRTLDKIIPMIDGA